MPGGDTSVSPCPRRCYGYFVPDREAQRQLGELGFDLAAPKRSFDPSQPPPPSAGVCFGGAHVSVLGQCDFLPRCLEQLRIAANRSQGWRAPAMRLTMRGHQATVYFNSSLLAVAARAAADAGWAATVREKGYHVGLYNSTLEERLTPEQATAMVECLQHAGWGWVLSVDDGNNIFKFHWATFIPSTPATVPALLRGTLCSALSRTYMHTRSSFETLPKWSVFQLSGSAGNIGSRWHFHPVWLGVDTRRRGETTVAIRTGREPAGSARRLFLHVRTTWSALVDSGKEREVLQLSVRGGRDAGSRWGIVRFDDGTVALRSHRADLYLQWVAAAKKWNVFRLHKNSNDLGCRWYLTEEGAS